MSPATNRVIITVASGKGGTGKTTVAANLAAVLARRGERVAYMDCDVEEPNGHLFLKPRIRHSQAVTVPVPQVDEEACAGCGECGRICRFRAIACLNGVVITFPDLCHGCGGCALVCPRGAITETPRRIGMLEEGSCGPLEFVQGLLEVGAAMPTPVVRAVKAKMPPAGWVIRDSPPGAACPAVETVRGSDYTLLVTEPTPFGLSDLKAAVEMLDMLGVPYGVLINRVGMGNGRVAEYCRARNIPVLLEIPHDRRAAEAYSRGMLLADALPEWSAMMNELGERLEREAAR